MTVTQTTCRICGAYPIWIDHETGEMWDDRHAAEEHEHVNNFTQAAVADDDEDPLHVWDSTPNEPDFDFGGHSLDNTDPDGGDFRNGSGGFGGGGGGSEW